ncbi:MAG: DUF3578 domain-containing protein [Bacteroidales bacterium]|nr:DUF3578 domain-containing protein [Bacteroidales bacterium]
MENLQTINNAFNQCFAKSSTFDQAQITSDIDKEVNELITRTIPQEISSYLDDSKYLVNGSVGKGRATKTPWIAILDKEITTTTRKGVYIVFLFSSDYKHVYLTLNQGTTVPGQFGPKLGKKVIAENSKRIRNLLNINNAILKTDGNADIADERYKLGAIYYTLWDVNDIKEGERVLKLYFSIYKKYKESFDTTPTSTIQSHETMTISPFSITSVVESILSTGLIYSETLIKRLAFSLMAKPFVILSGLAGSGKTQLALAFAKCLSESIEEQVCPVSIGADWTNREPLLGYPNALNKDEYVKPESGVLQLLMRANEDPTKPYFLILDEMNLSVVERYFADFLSAMESGEPIKLWDNEAGNVPKEIELPKNVFIIGTINVDETTYMFSPKVLDRANVIEFKIAADEMDDYLGKKVNINLEQAYSACADMAVDFVNKAKSQVEKDEKNKDILLSFFKELKEVNAEFGYRTVNEISRYLHFNDDDENGIKGDEAIDTAIVQKLLPKLHGSRKKLEPVLKQLWKLCFTGADRDLVIAKEHVEKARFKESADKIRRMYESAYANGFTSFAEA